MLSVSATSNTPSRQLEPPRAGTFFHAILLCCVLTATAAADPEPEPPAQTGEQPSSRAASTCELGDEVLPWIDRVHRQMFEMTCATAYWFDGFFGTQRYHERYRETHGSITPGLRWDERDEIDPSLRFRARLELPQLSEKYNAFIGRVDREEFVSDTEGDFTALPSRFGRSEDDETLLGLGYSRSRRVGHDVDASAGVRLRFPLDPYVKGSYRYLRPIGTNHLLRTSQTIFWQNSEGFGTTTRFDIDRALSDRMLLRWDTSGTFSEESQGVRWRSGFTLFQSLDTIHALAYQMGVAGETDREVAITDYGFRLIYRRRVWREWLLLELQSGVNWPRDSLEEDRRANFGFGVAFELHFGAKRGSPLPSADDDGRPPG